MHSCTHDCRNTSKCHLWNPLQSKHIKPIFRSPSEFPVFKKQKTESAWYVVSTTCMPDIQKYQTDSCVSTLFYGTIAQQTRTETQKSAWCPSTTKQLGIRTLTYRETHWCWQLISQATQMLIPEHVSGNQGSETFIPRLAFLTAAPPGALRPERRAVSESIRSQTLNYWRRVTRRVRRPDGPVLPGGDSRFKPPRLKPEQVHPVFLEKKILQIK